MSGRSPPWEPRERLRDPRGSSSSPLKPWPTAAKGTGPIERGEVPFQRPALGSRSRRRSAPIEVLGRSRSFGRDSFCKLLHRLAADTRSCIGDQLSAPIASTLGLVPPVPPVPLLVGRTFGETLVETVAPC